MTTNNKIVKAKIREHINDYYTPSELKAEVEALKKYTYPTDYHVVKLMVENGCFLCYHNDVKNFLNGLGINPTNKEYDSQKSWELYCHLIARDAQLILKNA